MPVLERVNRHVFDLVHRNNLVYNTRWENPYGSFYIADIMASSA